MKNLRIIDGDIVLGIGNHLAMVTGKDKLLQDLRLWLIEPFGTGFTTPNFGSLLSGYIGELNPEEQLSEIEDEVRRILGIYQAHQMENIRAAQSRGELSSYSKKEILNVIKTVEASAVRDAILVKVVIQNLSDTEIIIPLTIDLEGISVAS